MILTIAAVSLLAPKPNILKPRIEQASMFKNGLAVVTRTMDVPKSGEYWLETIPQASLGTLWFATTAGVKLKEVVATYRSQDTTYDVQTIDQLLMQNVGTRVRLGLKNGDAVTGNQVVGTIKVANPSMVMLDDGKQLLAIPRGTITSVAAVSGSLKLKVKTTGTNRALRFRVEATKPGAIGMISLENGLTWAPSYAIDITDPRTLKLSAKSTIINDLEDLKNIEARFVTGFPNLPYAFIPDPLTNAPSVQQFVNTISAVGGPGGGGGFGGGGGGFGGQMAANRAGEMRDFAAAMDPSVLAGLQSEDLFFYRQPNVTLKRGDRAYYMLFEAKADYSHLYTLNLDDAVQNDVSYRGVEPTTPPEVWHSLKFKNTAGQPLTTAAATIMKDGEILGQDMMKYTGRGAETEVRITKALDIRAEASEEELERQRQVLQLPNRPYYDLVSLKGTIVIVNGKGEKVDVKVTKEVTGEVTGGDNAPQVTKIAKRLSAINPRARLVWNLSLEPGQTMTLTYSYKVYIQS